MTKSRLRPIDKKEKRRPPMLGTKLFFLGALILLVLLTPEIIKNTHVYKKDDPKRKITFEIPKNVDLGKIINFKELETKGFELKDQMEKEVLGKTDKLISKTASDAASAVSSTVSKTVFDAAIKPIVKQIDNLPADQQKRARELICK